MAVMKEGSRRGPGLGWLTIGALSKRPKDNQEGVTKEEADEIKKSCGRWGKDRNHRATTSLRLRRFIRGPIIQKDGYRPPAVTFRGSRKFLG